jgi:hypothetical protein
MDLSDSDGEDNHMEGIENAASQEVLTNIGVLKASLQTNPSQYEVHIQLIALLKSAAMFEELRAAREAMSAVFPLSEGLFSTTNTCSKTRYIGSSSLKSLIRPSPLLCASSRTVAAVAQRRIKYGCLRGRKGKCAQLV